MIFLLFATVAVAETTCLYRDPQERVHVRHVVDGDTVILDDERHVRLIGFNAPELASKQRPAEPYAERARAELQRLIDRADGALVLIYGSERKDHYGRTLAHLFTPGETHLGAALLRRGLAMAIAVPPNLAFQGCLRAAEREARDGARGMWSAPRFRSLRVSELRSTAGGFVRVRGRLDGVGFSRDSLWLQIDGLLGVRIHKSDLRYFRRWNFHALRGRRVELRGWVSRRKGGWRMSLKHPYDVELLDE